MYGIYSQETKLYITISIALSKIYLELKLFEMFTLLVITWKNKINLKKSNNASLWHSTFSGNALIKLVNKLHIEFSHS